MKIPPNATPGSSSGHNTAKGIHTAVRVKARVSPGLFFVSIAGKEGFARTALDLLPGREYPGILQRMGDTAYLRIDEGSDIKIAQLLDAYREESGVEKDPLSDLLLSRYLHFEKAFDPKSFRRMYLQLIWFRDRFIQTADGSSSNSRNDTLMNGIIRLLLVLDEKKLVLSEKELVRLARILGNLPAESGDDASDEVNETFEHRREELELLQRFNREGQNRSRREAGWVIIPLEEQDEPGHRAFLRYNLNKLSDGISCGIKGWTFHWYPDDQRIMYYLRPTTEAGNVDESPSGIYGVNVEKRLLNYLKAVNFVRVEEMREMSSFDGFSIAADRASVRIDETSV
jgi:hypothetical protein